MNTYYSVRFNIYHYNSGRGDNGVKPYEDYFDDLGKAQVRAKQIKIAATSKTPKADRYSRSIAREYGYDGFVNQFLGIYKITEEKIS